MGLFGKKVKQNIQPELQSHHKQDEMRDLSDLNDSHYNGSFEFGKNIYSDLAKVKQYYSSSDFQNQDDDQGNYFAREFDIHSTVGRLKGLYAREPWVLAMANIIARTISTIDFNIVDSKSEDVLDNHEANEIVNSGNFAQDANTKIVNTALDLVLGGNGMMVLDEAYTKGYLVPIEDVTIHPRIYKTEHYTLEEMEDYGPLEYINISKGVFAGQTMIVDPEHFIHFKYPNPYTPYYGMSMLTAAARPILLDRYKNEFEMAFYLKGATNSGVIETQQEITTTRMDRLMKTFQGAFTGKRNWWKPLFLPKGAVWKNSSLTMNEMQHLEGLRENRRTLLAVLGVPPTLVGIVEDVNRSTSEIQEKIFWQNSILPLIRVIEEGWNNSYLFRKVYGGTVKVMADLDGIDAIEGSLFSKGEIINQLNTVLVINELREIAGYPPLKATDPRGNKFVTEIGGVSGLFGDSETTPDENLGPEDEANASSEADNQEKNLVMGNTDDGTGKVRHVHTARWDSETGNGKTLDTLGDGPKHKHDIKRFNVSKGGEDNHTHGKVNNPVQIVKKKAVSAQSNIEAAQVKAYDKTYAVYIGALIDQARKAINDERDIRSYLMEMDRERAAIYTTLSIPVLDDTLNKSYSFATNTTKRLKDSVVKGYDFSAEDEQALDAIKQETSSGQRKILADRSIQRFWKIDEKNMDDLMKVIERGMEDGKTQFEIGKDLEREYYKQYGGHAQTVSRTEVLTAVSQGIDWNHQVLGKVFSEVKKQWFHVGDEKTNEHARMEHVNFETVGDKGVVPSGYVYENPVTGGKMQFPRDPAGKAADVINCRCTLVSVIPDDATSRSDQILR